LLQEKARPEDFVSQKHRQAFLAIHNEWGKVREIAPPKLCSNRKSRKILKKSIVKEKIKPPPHKREIFDSTTDLHRHQVNPVTLENMAIENMAVTVKEQRDFGSHSSKENTSIAWSADLHCLALDGIRGLAILTVTLYRLCKELDPSGHPAIEIVRRFAPLGERGVDLFFVLSGFLITGILLRSKGKPHYFHNFIIRR